VVAVWSLRAPLLVSVALGGMAWLLVTGFDVNADGDLRFAGRDDVFRLVVLVVSGLAGLAVGRLLGGPAANRRIDGMPGSPEEYAGLGVYESSEVSGARYHHPVMVSPRMPRGHALPRAATMRARDERAHRVPKIRQIRLRKREMTDLVFIVLTVAVFAVLGLIVKAVERL
jgi:hypothetical protein